MIQRQQATDMEWDPEADYPALARANHALNLQEIQQGRSTLRSYPPHLQIDLIGVCNMRPACRMCPIDSTSRYAHSGMSADHLTELGPFLDHCLQLTNCSTGEPLIHPGLLSFLAHAQRLGKRLGFSTNGLALDSRMTTELLAHGRALAIVFSLDAATPETYARIRGRDWTRVLGNVTRFCAQARALPPDARPQIGLCFIPMRCNLHEVAAFISLAAELVVDYVEMRPLVDFGGDPRSTRDDAFDYQEQMLNPDELRGAYETAHQASSTLGVHLNWQHEVGPERPYPLFRPPELSPQKTPCTMPWTFVLPFQNGDTMPCCHNTESIGDWRRDGLSHVWNGPVATRIRATLASGRLPDECLRSRSCPVVLLHGSRPEEIPPVRRTTTRRTAIAMAFAGALLRWLRHGPRTT